MRVSTSDETSRRDRIENAMPFIPHMNIVKSMKSQAFALFCELMGNWPIKAKNILEAPAVSGFTKALVVL